MNRILKIFVTLLAVAGLMALGCNKKTDEGAAEEGAVKAAEGAAKAAEGAAKAAEGAAKAAEDTATDAKDDAAKAVAAAAEMAKNVDTSDAPEHMKKMVAHINQVTQAIKGGMPDCKKAAAAATAYVEKNKTDIEMCSKKMKEMSKDMKGPEAAKMGQQLMALMMPTMAEMQKVMMEFSQKCPGEAAEVGKAMNAMKAK